MRYSMKWILAAMVYVAIAAAAFSQESWVYADLLWLATFIAVCNNVMLAIVSRDSQRWRAVGFAVFATCFLTCLHFAPDSVPTPRIVNACFLEKKEAPAKQMTVAIDSGSQYGYAIPIPVSAVPGLPSYSVVPDHIVRCGRAANAVATMLCGLVGCLLGSLAYNRARRDALG